MMMKTVLAAGILIIGSGVAFADSDKLPAGAISVGQMTTKLQNQGFSVTKVESDDGMYKVKGMNATGQKQKLKVNPMTGSVVSTDTDD